MHTFGLKLTFPTHAPASTLYELKRFIALSTHCLIPFPVTQLL